ncbi:hypothetical protein ACFUNF_33790 [Streptomyces sp. NPDC057291]|uniref:hypothetical protein n=1 Tax=Streptomyces sp. NPDC057291 TaxID=3346087 RepID=UPI00362CFD56
MHTPADYLELARAEKDSSVLHRLARCPYSFAWQALAANPHTAPRTLLELSAARDSVWNDNGLLRLLAEHPRADRTGRQQRDASLGLKELGLRAVDDRGGHLPVFFSASEGVHAARDRQSQACSGCSHQPVLEPRTGR